MKFRRALVSGSLIVLSAPALADEQAGTGWTFIPAIAYQQKQLTFDQLYRDDISKLTNENGRKSHFRAMLPTGNLSFTAAHGKFYTALKYEQSIIEGSTTVTEIRPATRSGPYDPYYLNIPDEETKIKRKDASFTIGYNIWSGMNVFAGYMEGKTTLTPQVGCGFPCNPGVYPVQGVNLALDLANEGRGEYHQVYTEEGPYVGLSYGWQIAETGTLSASFAYARMNGNFKDNYVTSLGDGRFDFSGESVGTSIGLTWSAPLGESSAYFLDIRQQKYSMDANGDHSPYAYYHTVKIQTDESMMGLTAGLQFYF